MSKDLLTSPPPLVVLLPLSEERIEEMRKTVGRYPTSFDPCLQQGRLSLSEGRKGDLAPPPPPFLYIKKRPPAQGRTIKKDLPRLCPT